jgi:hypothetical protein
MFITDLHLTKYHFNIGVQMSRVTKIVCLPLLNSREFYHNEFHDQIINFSLCCTWTTLMMVNVGICMMWLTLCNPMMWPTTYAIPNESSSHLVVRLETTTTHYVRSFFHFYARMCNWVASLTHASCLGSQPYQQNLYLFLYHYTFLSLSPNNVEGYFGVFD